MSSPVISLSGGDGNLANRMIRLMAALSIQAKVKDCRIFDFQLEEWNIDIPKIAIPSGLSVKFPLHSAMNIEVDLSP